MLTQGHMNVVMLTVMMMPYHFCVCCWAGMMAWLPSC